MKTLNEEWTEYASVKKTFDAIVSSTTDHNILYDELCELAYDCEDGETAIPFIAILAASKVDEVVVSDVLCEMGGGWDTDQFYINCIEAGKLIATYKL